MLVAVEVETVNATSRKRKCGCQGKIYGVSGMFPEGRCLSHHQHIALCSDFTYGDKARYRQRK